MSVPGSSYEEIVFRLRQVVRRKRLYDLYRGLMLTVLMAAVLVIIVVAAETILLPGTGGRTALFVFITVSLSFFAAWHIIRPLLSLAGVFHRPGTLETASVVGERLPGIRDRLVDTVEMFASKDLLGDHYSMELIDGAFSSLCEDIRDVDLRSVISDSPVKRAARYAMLAAGSLVVFFFISPSAFTGSAYRILNYDTAFDTGPVLVLGVEPGNVEVVRGQPVKITVRVHGDLPEQVTLHTRPEGRIDFETADLTGGAPGIFTGELSGVRSTTEYFASTRETESGRYLITVVDRPMVKSFGLSVTPPSYTRLPAHNPGDNIGDVSALPGSRVDLRLSASKEVAAAHLVFGDSVFLPLTIGGSSVSGTFRVTREDHYRFRLEDAEGLTNPDPIEYSIRTVLDERPFVEIEEPGTNLDITGEMVVNLAVRIRDDFGFSRLRLMYRLEHSRYEQPSGEYSYIDLPLKSPGRAGSDGYGSQTVYYQWDLSKLSLVPEDVVSYFAEVWDNDNVSGPKSARSETFLLRLPSLEEVIADVNTASDRSLETLQKMQQEVRSLREQFEDLNREMRSQRNNVDWQQQKKAEQLSGRYETLRKKAEETATMLGEMVKKMDENRLLSENTLQKYEELQKLMKELNSPDLREALKKLQESMKKLTPEEMREAMQKMALSEEQFRKSLERTVELLKRIHIEQKIDELIARAEELKGRQDELTGENDQRDPSDNAAKDRLSEKQTDLGREAGSLEDESKELVEKMGEFSKEMPVEEMSEASKSLEESNIPESMEQSSSAMKSGDMQKARQQQEKASRDLKKFGDQMNSVAEALREKQMQQIVNEMRRQIGNLLDLSRNEEDIKDETTGMDPNSQRFREETRRQQENLEDLSTVADAMTGLSKKTFAIGPDMGREMGNAMKKMSDALNGMEQRNPQASAQAQKEAMGSVNRVAMMMQGSLAAMMNNEGRMGMAGLMGMLGQMAGMQQQINQGTQQAGGEGGKSGSAQMAEYGRLARQQGAVRKSLQELAQEAKASGEFSKMLGDIDRIAEDMLEVQTDLSQGDVNPETLQKQERILSRMLESQKSLRERDYENRRTAQSGTNVRRPSPAEINFGSQEGKNLLREELFQVREGKYSRDYEELIRKYFEKLEQSGSDRPE